MENKDVEFLANAKECYKLYGLRTTIDYIYTTFPDFKNKIIKALNEIYIIEEIELEEQENILHIIEDISNDIKSSQNLIILNRGYKGEWPKNDFIKLQKNSARIKYKLEILIHLIKSDINTKLNSKYQQNK